MRRSYPRQNKYGKKLVQIICLLIITFFLLLYVIVSYNSYTLLAENKSYNVPSFRSSSNYNRDYESSFGFSDTIIPPITKEFEETIHQYVQDDTIMISVFDSGFFPQFISFYHSSIISQNIHNFVAIALDYEAYKKTKDMNIPCVLLSVTNRDISTLSSDYNSIEFINKVNMKTLAILYCLRLGYNVLLSDVDILIFKNPFKYFTCHDCDIHIQREIEDDYSNDRNSGFVYARHTKLSYRVFYEAWLIYKTQKVIRQQPALNLAISLIQKEGLKIQLLNINEFPSGWYYFEKKHNIYWDSMTCKECIIVHNNWIVSADAKIYRFKELGLFKYDENQYYSSITNKYMIYHSLPQTSSLYEETEYLKKALLIALSLKRILILPKFSCHTDEWMNKNSINFMNTNSLYSKNSHINTTSPSNANSNTQQTSTSLYTNSMNEVYMNPNNECTLNSFWCIKQFNKILGTNYREHSFLHNSLVPKQVVDAAMDAIPISFLKKHKSNNNYNYISNPKTNTVDYIQLQNLLFSFSHSQVIIFDNIPFKFKNPHYQNIVDTSLVTATYRQYEC